MTSTSGHISPDLDNAEWFKSSASSGTGGCLEVAFLPDGRVALRDNQVFSASFVPCVVEDECGLGDGADSAWAECDVLECTPALLKGGGGTFAHGS